jgi:anhydro-N-acetylmuramic acid kinase
MDFRRRDLALGGQGAPLVPLFHEVLLRGKTAFPAAGLNIGGVANITFLADDMPVTAADTGPGMGLLDQLFLARTGDTIDDGGRITTSGKANDTIVARLTSLPYYSRPFPRSADRYEFVPLLEAVNGLDLPDAAATLAAVTARGVAHTAAEFGWKHKKLLWCGGGGRNLGVIAALEKEGFEVAPMAQVTGLREDWVEAACFGWLAVRHLRGLPFSLPTTTGSTAPSVGGVRARA